MSLASLCNTRAVVLRNVITESESGGQAAGAPTVVYTDVPCTIQATTGVTVEMFSRRQMVVNHTMYTPSRLELKPDDVVQAADGRNFQVKAFGDMGGRGVATRVYLQIQD